MSSSCINNYQTPSITKNTDYPTDVYTNLHTNTVETSETGSSNIYLPEETNLIPNTDNSSVSRFNYNLDIGNFDLEGTKGKYLLHVGIDDFNQIERCINYCGSYFIDIEEVDNDNGYYEIDSSSLIPQELEHDLLSISEDGTKILLLSNNNQIKTLEVYDLIDNISLYRYETKEDIYKWRVSATPDLDYILFESGSDFVYVDVNKKTEKIVNVGGLISPEGLKAAVVEYIEDDTKLYIYEILTGKLIDTINVGNGRTFLSQWHNSNKILYYTIEGSFVYDIRTEEIKTIGEYLYEPKMSPDGRYVAFYRGNDAGWFFPLYDGNHWLLKEYGYREGLYVKDLLSNKTNQVADILFTGTYASYAYKQFPVEWVYVNKNFDNSKYRSCSLVNDETEYEVNESSMKDGYYADSIFDGNIQTAWVEDEESYSNDESQSNNNNDIQYSGEGLGEWVKIFKREKINLKSVYQQKQFGYIKPMTLSGVRIINGYAKSKDIYAMNNRIKKVEIILSDGTNFIYTLEDDTLNFQTLDFGKEITTRYITIKILEVYKGSKFNDTCISEVELISTDK